jgi:hypothetical protein
VNKPIAMQCFAFMLSPQLFETLSMALAKI